MNLKKVNITHQKDLIKLMVKYLLKRLILLAFPLYSLDLYHPASDI